MIFAQQSSPYEAVYESGVTGLVGIVSVMVVDNQGSTVTSASTAGIIEVEAGTGVYSADRVAPADTGQFTVIWSIDGTFDDGTISVEDLVVAASEGAEPLPPLPPLGQTGAPQPGPCSAWTDGDAVAACCDAEFGTDTSVFDDVVAAASELLYHFSGRRFSGSCQRTVRPCATTNGCGFQVLSRGHVVGWYGDGWYDDRGPFCGCEPLSSVPLAGYPVREIVEVLIDGSAVDPGTYRLDRYRDLVRVSPDVWPACQNLGLPSTEDGTFAVTYLYGIDPPLSGRAAAAELACQLYQACNGGDCVLPTGVTRVTRQGTTFDLAAFRGWAYQPPGAGGIRAGWNTGLPQVDLFLSAYNPSGLQRRPAVYSPDAASFARTVG